MFTYILSARKNSRHFADDNFEPIILYQRTDDIPLYEPMMSYFIDAYGRHTASMNKQVLGKSFDCAVPVGQHVREWIIKIYEAARNYPRNNTNHIKTCTYHSRCTQSLIPATLHKMLIDS